MGVNIPLKNVTNVNVENHQVTKPRGLIEEALTLKNINKTQSVINDKIYVRQIKGFFQKIRKYSLSALLIMYFSFVWVRINDEPIILFDLLAQKFYLFGMILWPQDFTLLALALIISAFGLFFLTSLFGRVWCGYSCPQTAWSFMFIWLEEFFEGSRHQRIKLDKSPFSLDKALKKIAKHCSWLFIAIATAITFVGYFYPIRELLAEIFTFSLQSGVTWFWLLFFTIATYLNAGWLREKVCIYMCPYARFQSVMFNENTMVVGYDEKRGESRGSRSRGEKDSQLGDCIDCQICVQVCPVGIDIRDGLQYECIGCALCIDACDSIMVHMNYPKGLIRYASEKEFEHNRSFSRLNKTALAYGLILILAIGVFGALQATRPLLELTVLRDRGALYSFNGVGQVENYYTLKLVNKSNVEAEFLLGIRGLHGAYLSEKLIRVEAGEVNTFPVTVSVDPQNVMQSTTSISFTLQSLSKVETMIDEGTKFLATVNTQENVK